MADDADRAAELAEAERVAALATHRRRQESRPERDDTCVDCGEPIPPARRQAVVTRRCAPCAAAHERRR